MKPSKQWIEKHTEPMPMRMVIEMPKGEPLPIVLGTIRIDGVLYRLRAVSKEWTKGKKQYCEIHVTEA
jgi:hypothetical protein